MLMKTQLSNLPARLGRMALAALVCLPAALAPHLSPGADKFTPLVPLPKPGVLKGSTEDPGGNFAIAHFFDGVIKTEFASRDAGTNTMLHLDFGKPTRFAAMRHVERNDGATVARSELEFFDGAGRKVATLAVKHVNRRAGETLFIFPEPITAQTVKWRAAEQGNKGLFCLGGAELAFFDAEPDEPTPKRDRITVKVLPFLEREGTQPVRVTIEHPYVQPAEISVRLAKQPAQVVTLKPGANAFDWKLPQAKTETTGQVEVSYHGQSLVRKAFPHRPVKPMTVYILPHSHTDIGYTEIQTAIEDKQVKNVVDGIAATKATASYPEGSRFVWNVEVGWAADLYLQRMNEPQKADFFQAVKEGRVVINGMYLNELTGLCRPEELVQLFRFSTLMAERTGVPIDSAMISDVPGFTWGTVPAMVHAGIKYFSVAPNYFDRIGTILREWENRPFYWEGPDGNSRVLVWIPFWGYAMSHIYHQMTPQLVNDFYEGLETRAYPYDIAYVRWSGHGDNAVPDPAICDFVRDWNGKYSWPRFIISGTGEAFRAFEKRYGSQLPVVRGDWTPYWEDGAGSSALQTAQNRHSSDRLTQAASLFAMRRPNDYPLAEFTDAWRNVLLYSEHTWGAWCSVSQPERKETLEQWEIKKSYADQAEAQTRALLAKALAPCSQADQAAEGIEILNTLSWSRTELVTVPAELSKAGDRVLGSKGEPVPSQRLKSGELAFVADGVPPMSSLRYTVGAGTPASPKSPARASGAVLENGLLRVRVDETTGGIVELTARGIDGNLVDTSGGMGLNDYRYLIGDDPSRAQGNGPVRISVGETGPLVASLIIESEAAGCKQLRRELRLVAGQDAVEVINLVNKQRLNARSYMDKEGKESLNFAFPFRVPDGTMLMDLPLGAAVPERDQMPSACKNWLTVGRWVDVANRDHGITWVTLDAPLIQAGYLSATLLNSQTNPDVWRKRIDKTQTIYSWAMNNHWGTNYRAYQEGPVIFRFLLRPHRGKTDPAEATRFSTGRSQPLIAARASRQPTAPPLLQLSSPDVVVVGLKPSDDQKAIIVRLFGASGKDQKVKLQWGATQPKSVHLSDTSERRGRTVGDKLSVPGYGLITLRAEL
jgi:hypothetical protein